MGEEEYLWSIILVNGKSSNTLNVETREKCHFREVKSNLCFKTEPESNGFLLVKINKFDYHLVHVTRYCASKNIHSQSKFFLQGFRKCLISPLTNLEKVQEQMKM